MPEMAGMRIPWSCSISGKASARGTPPYPAILSALLLLLLISCATPRVAAPGGESVVPALVEGYSGEGYFLARDGRELPLRMWLPQDKNDQSQVVPGAVIAALHGFNDYSNAFETTGIFLARRGIATYAFDQRGFGAGPQAGLWAGVTAMTNDARDFVRVLRLHYPGVPLFFLGESMGAAVIMASMTEDASSSVAAVDGVILLAPAVWARETMSPLQVGLLWLVAHTMPGVQLTGQGLRIRASDNNTMLRALSADPLVIKETRVDAMYGLSNLMDAALASAPLVAKMRAPMLILYGRRDEVIPIEPVAVMLERLPDNGDGNGGDDGGGEITLGVYDRGFHMLTRDLQGWRVMEDMAAWIADPAAPLPSGAHMRARERLAEDE